MHKHSHCAKKDGDTFHLRSSPRIVNKVRMVSWERLKAQLREGFVLKTLYLAQEGTRPYLWCQHSRARIKKSIKSLWCHKKGKSAVRPSGDFPFVRTRSPIRPVTVLRRQGSPPTFTGWSTWTSCPWIRSCSTRPSSSSPCGHHRHTRSASVYFFLLEEQRNESNEVKKIKEERRLRRLSLFLS